MESASISFAVLLLLFLTIIYGIYKLLIKMSSSGSHSSMNPNTKICKYCKSEIDKKASICPYCRKRQNGLADVIAACFIIAVLLYSCHPESGSGDNKVTQLNYEKIQSGMSYEDVCGVFGKEGVGHYTTEVSASGISYTYDYYYWYAPDGSFALVGFNDDEMVTGMAYNLK